VEFDVLGEDEQAVREAAREPGEHKEELEDVFQVW
jgi:hypothetical protein